MGRNYQCLMSFMLIVDALFEIGKASLFKRQIVLRLIGFNVLSISCWCLCFGPGGLFEMLVDDSRRTHGNTSGRKAERERPTFECLLFELKMFHLCILLARAEVRTSFVVVTDWIHLPGYSTP